MRNVQDVVNYSMISNKYQRIFGELKILSCWALLPIQNS